MRIWSLHPRYLDAKGLVALWRETLLAKNVLEGKTKGYRNHPQLERFKNAENPLHCINYYLSGVYHEAIARNYNFDSSKIDWKFDRPCLTVTKGQMNFEATHLLNKLLIRDKQRSVEFSAQRHPEPHPLFVIVDGAVESWEIIS